MSAEAPPRTLDLALFGIVNAGKSTLLNGLLGAEAQETSPIGGTTRDSVIHPWKRLETSDGPFEIRLIDTPGLGEVGESVRDEIALDAARRAELVVFVTAEDLTRTGLVALQALREAGKPLLLAINKVDLLDPDERDEILASVRKRTEGLVDSADVVLIAAAPLLRERIVKADGAVGVETRRGSPQLETLTARIDEHLAISAAVLVELNEVAARLDAELTRAGSTSERRARAERVADETAIGLAVAMAANPIPLLDLLTGPSGLAILVARVAGVYEIPLTSVETRSLARELVRAGRSRLWGSLAAIGLGGVMKLVPGIGHVAGALAQGVAAGTLAHLLGRAMVTYCENGRTWGDAGLAELLDRLTRATDRRALTRGLVEKLRARLGAS